MRRLLFLFSFLPFIVLADDLANDPTIQPVENARDFALIKAAIARDLDSAATNVSQMVSEFIWAQRQISDIYAYWSAAGMVGDEYGRGGKDAAEDFYDVWSSYAAGTGSRLDSALTSISDAQRKLALINYVPATNSDYTNVLEFIATNTWNIGYFTQTATNQLAFIITNLYTISELCQDCLPLLTDFLMTILPDLNETWGNFVDFMEYVNDAEDTFQQFYDLAFERLEKPESNLQFSLAQAWTHSLNHINEIFAGISNATYRTETPLESLKTRLNNRSVHLSNEGWILAESLQAQTWSYWIEAEMLKHLQYITDNFTNNPSVFTDDALASMTNWIHQIWEHQTICQEPYYQLYNETLFTSVREASNPYVTSTFNVFTNFIETARNANSLIDVRRARQNYRSIETNWFNRVESQLLLLNGLIPSGFTADYDEYLSQNVDEETISRRFDYATNALLEVKNTLSTVSNQLFLVTSEFKSLLNAFNLPDGHLGFIILGNTWEIGGIQFEMPSLSWGELSDLLDPIRVFTNTLWYFIFGVLSFRLVCITIFLFGRAITHTILIISTLMH